MKILLACYFFLPQTGGLNKYVDILKKELERHGHQVDVMAHHPDLTKIHLLDTGKTIEKSEIYQEISYLVYNFYQTHFPYVDTWIRWREIERYSFELIASLYDLDQYDVIHTQDIVSTRALWRVKPTDIPLVSTIHGILATEYLNSGHITTPEGLLWEYVAAEERCGHLSSDQTIVPTKWQKFELNKLFAVPKNKLQVIPYGLDVPEFLNQMNKDIFPTVPKPTNRFVIICPARLVPEKGHKILIEALSIMKEKRTDFICWFVGDGFLRADLENYCLEKGVRELVIFLGNRADVPALLAQAELLVLPSVQDMQPYAVIEGQLAGKAVIASDAGGLPEMIKDGKSGLLFASKNSLRLAEKIVEIMNDSGYRKRLQQNAKSSGKKRWSSVSLYRRTMKVYDGVIAAKPSASEYLTGESRTEDRFILPQGDLIKKNSATDIFQFKVEWNLENKLWDAVLQRLPVAYTIPDPYFMNLLSRQPY